jgi:hypothetical protein
MVEYYIKDIKENQLLPPTKILRNSSLVGTSKKSKIKFIRQQIVDSNYNSIIFEKVNFTKDKIMSHYHKILEKSLNSSVVFTKKPEDVFKNQKKIWSEKPKTGVELSQKYSKELMDCLSSQIEEDSVDSPFLCEIFTMKLLKDISKSRQLQIPIPESVIYGHGFDSATYIFNDSKGTLNYLPKQTTKTLEIISKIFSHHRHLTPLITGPVAIYRGSNSDSNKLYMREKELKSDLHSLHKKDVLVQRYILPKGSISSKFRVVLRHETIRVFKVSNTGSFDRSAYIKKKKEPQSNQIGVFPNLKLELVKKLTEKSFIFNRSGFSVKNESHFEDIAEFMNCIQPFELPVKLEDLYCELFKMQGKTSNEPVEPNDDVIAVKIYSKLKSMFCTYSKSSYSSKITEIKSQRICESLTSLFNYIKEVINSSVLREKNLKISEFICDFFEDSSKNIFFSQIKSCRCVKSLYIPLKNSIKEKQRKKKFSCPGKYCQLTSSAQILNNSDDSTVKISKTFLNSKFSVLRGTLEQEKFDQIDNIQKLNPRLFEKVQVCENCFKTYNENLKKPLEDSKVQKKIENPQKNKQDPKYMAGISQKLNLFTRISSDMINHVEGRKEVKRMTRNCSFFDVKRRSILKAIQIEDFL